MKRKLMGLAVALVLFGGMISSASAGDDRKVFDIGRGVWSASEAAEAIISAAEKMAKSSDPNDHLALGYQLGDWSFVSYKIGNWRTTPIDERYEQSHGLVSFAFKWALVENGSDACRLLRIFRLLPAIPLGYELRGVPEVPEMTEEDRRCLRTNAYGRTVAAALRAAYFQVLEDRGEEAAQNLYKDVSRYIEEGLLREYFPKEIRCDGAQ